MSPQPGRDPLGVLVSLAWSIFFVCVLLAAAVWLLQQIWVWLVAALVVTAVLWVFVLWLRARRDRW